MNRSISFKDFDLAFQQPGIGSKAGLEIWVIENEHPSSLPRSQFGRFSTGKSYIVLQTRTLRNGSLQHEIYYWLGKFANEAGAKIAAIKALELAVSLGGNAVQAREIEGYESDKFLSYFKPCIIPFQEKTALSDASVEAVYEKRMFSCDGRHVVRIKEVPFSRSSLNHDHVFIVDTDYKVFQFNGSNTDIYQRTKALDVVQYLQENFHKEKCHVAIIEDGKFVADADSGEFWSHFGGFAPLMQKMEDKECAPKETAGSLFMIYDREANEIQSQPLKREALNTNKSYVLDCGNELFVWMGSDTSFQERKAAILVAQEMSSSVKSPRGIKAIFEGREPIEFRSKFVSWPINSMSPISEGGRGKVAVLLKQRGFNVNGLLKGTTMKENPQHLSNIGKLQVWQVNGNSRESLPSSECGKFYSSCSYVVVHSCTDKKEHLVCSWLGHQSTMGTRKSCLQYANEVASSLQENVIQARIVQGKEPTQFLSLFEKLFVMKGNHDRVRLFQVHRSAQSRWHAIQVDAAATTLNSSSCFFLQVGETLFVWHGKFSNLEEQEATKKVAYHFKPKATVTNVKEGSETQLFWNSLGGRQSYPSYHEPKNSAKDLHLFSCHSEGGDLKFKEIFNFTQEDLINDEISILDCYTEIFVWVGRAASSQLKISAIEVGQKYLEWASKYGGVSIDVPIYKITDGCEPTNFTSFFDWDPTLKAEKHLNSFEKKLSGLRGETISTAQVLKAQVRSNISEAKTFQLVANKAKRIQNVAVKQTQSAERSHLVKENNVGQGNNHLAKENNVGQGKHAAVASTPNVKLSVRTPRIMDSSGNSPPATPRHSRTPSATPRHVSSTPTHRRVLSTPMSPAIATLASVYETFEDRFAFAWPGVYRRYDDKPNQDSEFSVHQYNDENVPETPKMHSLENAVDDKRTTMKWREAYSVKTMKTEEAYSVKTMKTEEAYPYERLKVSSNTVLGIDTSKRESYLSEEEFQKVFHMDKDTFYKLPRWKQDKYKVLHDLF